MIIRNDKATIGLYKGTKEIIKRYKGTLVVYEAFKNLIASGVPPLTLVKSVGKDLVGYKIYGNSVQDGTPTPEAPIEIESVGTRTKNLLKSTGNVLGTITPTTGNINTIYKYATTSDFISLKAETYTISYSPEVKSRNIVIYNKNKEVLSYIWTNRQNPFTFTIEQDSLIRVDMEMTGQLEEIDNLETFFSDYEVQIVEGKTATNCEPYGYKIPVKIRSKNRFDYTKLPNTSNKIEIIDNGVRLNGYAFATSITPEKFLEMTGFKEGEKITTSLNAKIVSGKTNLMLGVFMFYAKTGSGVSDFYLTDTHEADDGIAVTTKTIPIGFNSNNYNALYLYGGFNDADGNLGVFELTDIQIERGSSKTNCEPYVEPITTNIYLDEPLRMIEKFADYIDFENKKLYRKIKQGQINENTNFAQFSRVTNYSAFYINLVDMVDYIENKGINAPILSPTFAYYPCGGGNVNDSWGGAYQIGGSLSDTYKRVNFSLPNTITDVTSAKEWLKDNPVDCFYPTSEPIEETIELPNIPTIKGTTVIEVDTEVQPSNMEIIYKGKGE